MLCCLSFPRRPRERTRAAAERGKRAFFRSHHHHHHRRRRRLATRGGGASSREFSNFLVDVSSMDFSRIF